MPQKLSLLMLLLKMKVMFFIASVLAAHFKKMKEAFVCGIQVAEES
jgi:hypothetical protein